MQRTGRATVSVNGSQLRSMAGATLQIGGVQREPEVTDQGVVVYGEKLVPATVSCEMPHCSDTDLEALRNFKNGTVNYLTDTGVTFTVSDAFTTSVGDLQNGKVSVNFAGNAAKGG